MRVLATYDIATDTPEGRRRLNRVARKMEGFGVRIQKSVFECDLDATQFEKLLTAAEALIDRTTDSVIFFRLGACCSGRTLRLGVGAEPFTPDRFVIRRALWPLATIADLRRRLSGGRRICGA